MQQWDTIELSWVSDLISPIVAGKYFSRHGLRVVVSSDDFENPPNPRLLKVPRTYCSPRHAWTLFPVTPITHSHRLK